MALETKPEKGIPWAMGWLIVYIPGCFFKDVIRVLYGLVYLTIVIVMVNLTGCLVLKFVVYVTQRGKIPYMNSQKKRLLHDHCSKLPCQVSYQPDGWIFLAIYGPLHETMIPLKINLI